MIRILKFALFGAIGFGIGRLLIAPLAMLVYAAGEGSSSSGSTRFVVILALIGLFYLATQCLGGILLGKALEKGWKVTTRLALFSGIAFVIGDLLDIWLLSRSLSGVPPSLILLRGAFLGMALGLALNGWKKIVLLTLVGIFGFFLGTVTLTYSNSASFLGLLESSFTGVFGGALLGASIGIIEKQ